jgi:hypothetical protein
MENTRFTETFAAWPCGDFEREFNHNATAR